MIAESDNIAATQCILDQGFQFINHCLHEAGFYNNNSGFWIGKTYSKIKWDAKGQPYDQGGTAYSVARFLTLLAQRKLISATVSNEMGEISELYANDGWFKSPLLFLTSTRRVKLEGKIGVLLDTNKWSECAHVERHIKPADPSKGIVKLRYVAVILDASNPEVLEKLIVELDNCIVELQT